MYKSLIVVHILAMLFNLSACGPVFNLYWEKKFDRHVDVSCIRQALLSLSSKDPEHSYVSNEHWIFTDGAEVVQFLYAPVPYEGTYILEVSNLDNNKSIYRYIFQKSGNRPSEDVIKNVTSQLAINNSKIASRCGLIFTMRDFKRKTGPI